MLKKSKTRLSIWLISDKRLSLLPQLAKFVHATSLKCPLQLLQKGLIESEHVLAVESEGLPRIVSTYLYGPVAQPAQRGQPGRLTPVGADYYVRRNNSILVIDMLRLIVTIR